MAWSEDDLLGPEGEDWRVPVSELERRQTALSTSLRSAGMSGALIQNPVDLYYFAGGRQNASLWIPAEGETVQYVRRSARRAKYEAGGDASPHEVVSFPRLSEFADELRTRGANGNVGLQKQAIPASFSEKFTSVLSGIGDIGDCSTLVHGLREIKSPWEIEQMRVGAEIQLEMFQTIAEIGLLM